MALFSGLSSFLGTVFTAAKKTKAVFVTTMVGAGINIVLNFALIPLWGGYGAAIATAVGYLATFFSRLKGANSIMHLDVDYKKHFFRLGVLLLMVVVSCADSWINYAIGFLVLLMERDFIADVIKKVMRRFYKKRN